MALSLINNLYPPIFVRSSMPAFIYTESCKIYFSISDYNTVSDFQANAAVQITVQYQKTNRNALNTTMYPSGIKLSSLQIDNNKQGADKYYIVLESRDMQNGFELDAYYKIQLRFTGSQASAPPESGGIDAWLNDNLQYFSEWSQVVLIRGISQPVIVLTGLTPFETTTFNLLEVPIIGSINFSQSTETEKIQKYCIYLYHNNELIQSSGQIYINNYQQTNRINYSFKTELQIQQTYTVKIQIVTSNLYTWDDNKIYTTRFYIASNSEVPLDIILEGQAEHELSTIKIRIINKYFETQDLENLHKIVKGIKLLIKRSSHKSNFSVWDVIDELTIKENILKALDWRDYSVEPGVWYKYQIIRFNTNGVRTSSIKTEDAYMVDPEDIYLVGEQKQFNIKFNPQLSGMSIKVAQALNETIGSQYPFIRRNGNLCYKTFSLSGSITGFTDIKYNTFKASKRDVYGQYKQLYDNYNNNHNIDLYHDYLYQKIFRDKVIEFLYKNNIKLYKSATQGNLLVKLSNITLTPNTSLARLIYDFSCTVYEIAEYNLENCRKYNILPQDEYIAYEEVID